MDFRHTLAVILAMQLMTGTIRAIEGERDLFCLFQTAGLSREDYVGPWIGVGFDDGRVRTIRWSYGCAGVKSLDWLPPKLGKLELFHRKSRKRLHTRCLPRTLMFCWIVMSDVFGKVDLVSLPAPLQVLNLQSNRIAGTISLTYLPRNISAILFWGNPIQKVVVDNDALPHTLRKVHFHYPKKVIKIQTIDGSTADRRISLSDLLDSQQFKLLLAKSSCSPTMCEQK